MKIHEYQAKELLQASGIPVADGEVTSTVDEALAVAKRVGYPAVLKSQVLIGGRGKAGGIKIVNNEDELQEVYPQLKKLVIKGYSVDKILVVRSVNIKQEFYAAITIDPSQNDIVLITSPSGGMDIEEVAHSTPEKIYKYYFRQSRQIDSDRWKKFVKDHFQDESSQRPLTDMFNKLLDVFIKHDCSLVEINPLAVDDKGQWRALDAKITFDDNALYRHEGLEDMRDLQYEDPDEVEAKQHDLSFVKLDGNVGCIVNGAGLAMTTMDVIKLEGGDPANFLDVGGSSSPEKVFHALDIILRNKNVKVILINIFGGITRCDDIAQGIIDARKQLKFTIPLVVRLTGTNEEEAVTMLKKEGLNSFSTMREAIVQAVKLAH